MGDQPTTLVEADFNDDGKPDLAVSTYYGVSVLLGNGDGTFQPAIDTGGVYGYSIVAGYFNADSNPDLAIAQSSSVLVLLGNGDGTFQTPISYNVTYHYDSRIAAGDLNGDGFVDLVVAGDSSANLDVLMGNGDGTFGPVSSFPLGAIPNSLALGDMTGDGVLDVVTSGRYTNSLAILKGAGNGTFLAPYFVVVGSAYAVTLADFDGNGALDIAFISSGSVAVALGNGNGTFQAAISYPGGGSPVALAASDLDGDGAIDIAAANGYPCCGGTNGEIFILRGIGDGTFSGDVSYLTAAGPVSIVANDFDGDGLVDLATSHRDLDLAALLLGNGDGTFRSGLSQPISASGPGAAGDFDGDGIPDLAFALNDQDSISIALGNGDGTFRDGGLFPAGDAPVAVSVGDFNNDGIPDLVSPLYYQYQSAVGVLLGNSDGTFKAPLFSSGALYTRTATPGDFNGDGNLDVAVTIDNLAELWLLPGNGDGTFGSAIITPLVQLVGWAIVFDFNGDGKLDFAGSRGGCCGSSDVAVLLGNGDGSFQPEVGYPAGIAPSSLALGDFNHDGLADIVAANDGTTNISILRGTGGGTFAAPVTVGVGWRPNSLVVADVDGDGNEDIAVSSGYSDIVALLLGLGNGSFLSPTGTYVGHSPTQLFAGNFTGGDAVDLAAVGNDPFLTVLVNSRLSVSPPTVSGGCLGSTATLKALAAGFGPLTYQWRKDGAPLADGGSISGATTATLTISPAAFSDSGSYDVIVVDSCTTVTSAATTLTVADIPPQPVISVAASVPPGIGSAASVMSPLPGHTYTWMVTGAVILTGQGTDQISFLAAFPGTMTLQVVDYATTSCGTASATANIPVDYLDVPPSNLFHADIVMIAQAGITAGCGNGYYCPNTPVTRAQMAVFLLKSKYGANHVPPVSYQAFFDVPPGSFAYDWINELYTIGVTTGCGNNDYCPDASVTRAQMAVFLLKTLFGSYYYPPFGPQLFDDVPQYSFAANYIEDLYNRGITGGCSASPPLYCPDSAVNRGQMATFLVRTFLTPGP